MEERKKGKNGRFYTASRFNHQKWLIAVIIQSPGKGYVWGTRSHVHYDTVGVLLFCRAFGRRNGRRSVNANQSDTKNHRIVRYSIGVIQTGPPCVSREGRPATEVKHGVPPIVDRTLMVELVTF